MPRLSKIGAACLAAFGYTQGTSTIAANYLVVAGGAGGGGGASVGSVANGRGGGGGAGGAILGITNLNFTLSYVITVGAGGTGATSGGSNGSNSVFDTFATAIGGGTGAYQSGSVNGASGGSGGGGSGFNNPTGGAGTSGQGNAGGTTTQSGQPYSASGGGGAGAAGASIVSTSTTAGAGGIGIQSSISGTSTYYAGGGGGGSYAAGGGTGGAGGNGGGGAGGTTTGSIATSGATNTGGGGGGAEYQGGSGKGGSGVVIISYTSPTQLFGGGTVTYSGGNWIHTFTTSGTLVPVSTFTASVLTVGGGGGGGSPSGGGAGGGGAGGYRTTTSILDTNSNYIVTVGSGGVGGSSSNGGTKGNDSSFIALTSTGGGYGGGYNSTSNGYGGAGGSGGGGSGNRPSSQGGAGNTPSTSPSQGNNGGNATDGITFGTGGGGGGGASAVGSSATTVSGANGGNGTANTISGSSVTYAGGGGGGYDTRSAGSAGTGGTGGGGNGSGTTGANGTANTGGGGGGGGWNGSAGTGGTGGSGVVIISYAGAQRMAGGTVTFVGGNTIHTFTSSGYLSALKLVNNSLRFKASTSSSLTRTPTVAGNRKTWTWSGWVKRGALGVTHGLFSANFNTTGGLHYCYFNTNDALLMYIELSAGIKTLWTTNAVFRDPAAWYHVVIAFDTTQAAVANMCKIYINGVLQSATTSNVSATYISQNADGWINNTTAHYIGSGQSSYTYYFDGYMTEINFVDGQALTPSSFGGYNSFGVWQPTQYLGSFGNNGFYLPFTNNASSTTIGYDFSPNQNNWTSTGFTLTPTTSVAYDSMTDVPTLTSATASNWCVANPLDAASGLTINDGNLKLAASAAGSKFVRSSIALPSSGAFYAEITFANASSASIGETIGICTASRSLTAANNAAGAYLFYASALGALISNGTTLASSLTAIAANELFQVAIDVTNSKMWIGRTNVWYNSTGGTTGNPSTGANPTFTGAFVDYFIYAGFDTASAVTANINFGQKPFAGTVPTGFVALNTFNM